MLALRSAVSSVIRIGRWRTIERYSATRFSLPFPSRGVRSEVMKLYGMNLSNFATKSRIVVYEKGANIEIAAPPGGMKSPEYLKINQLGKIPTLDADGTII